MTGLRRLLRIIFVAVWLVGATILVFGSGMSEATTDHAGSFLEQPSGLSKPEGQQLTENQLAGLLDEKKLTANDAQALDLFGYSVAIDGNTVIVGAREENGGPGDPMTAAGAAYIFERNQGGVNNWGQVTKLTAADAQTADLFGISVAIFGDTVVVGAIWEDGGAGDPVPTSGAAYIFERNQGGANNWGQVAKLSASDAQEVDDFGNSVAINGDTIVVGAFLEDGGPGDPLFDAGAAYIFERNMGGANNWGEVAKLTASDAQDNDYFGRSVSISGDTAIVGADLESGGPGDPLFGAGAAYIFGRNTGGANNWGEVKKLVAADAQTGDRFGFSVNIFGNTVIVGAPWEDGGVGDPLINAGRAYIFSRDNGGPGTWGQVTILTSNDIQSDDLFGFSGAISGDNAIVGAMSEDGGHGDPLSGAGAAYTFERNLGGANNWGEVTKLTAVDAQINDRFGDSVSISGSTVIVGAPTEDGGPGNPANNSGAAYIYWRIDFVYLPAINNE